MFINVFSLSLPCYAFLHRLHRTGFMMYGDLSNQWTTFELVEPNWTHGKHPDSANRRLVNLAYSPNEQHSQCKDLPSAAPFTSKMLGNSSTDSYNCQPRAKLIDDYGEFIIIILTYGFTFFAGFIGEYSLSRRMARFNLLSSLLICFRFWRW